MKSNTHYLVIGAESEIVFSTPVSAWGNEDIAKSFCHEHINDCISNGIDGAGGWVVRGVFCSTKPEGSSDNVTTKIIETCLYLLNRMVSSESFYDVMHFTESYDRIAELLFSAAGFQSELTEMVNFPVSYNTPEKLIKHFNILQSKEHNNAN